ncbi:MAG: UvrD-helicase domain-containing protein [Balneola sp.]
MKQLDVFSAPINGISLVEASAGTGKTYSITSLYIRVIIEKKLHPSKILVLTYTEAATTELKLRIRKRINETIDFLNSGISSEDDFLNTIKKNVQPSAVHDLKQALFSFDEASIFTIHGFSQKLLREESFSFGVQPDFEIIQDSSEIFQDAVDSFWRESVEKYSSTDQGKGILEYLIKEKISPETIKPVIEIAISKPYARILPEHSLAKEIDEKIERIQKLNDHIKYIWEDGRDELHDIIFSGKLNKRSYKPETFREVWKDLEKWISRSTTNFSGFAKLENFGELKLSTSVNKGNEITVPKISELIDQFLEETKELNILKAGFLKEAIVKVKDEIEARKERINSLSF